MMNEKTYSELKKGGFMRQIQTNKFSLRLRVVGGQMQAAQLLKVSEIADKYGAGYIHLTSRQGIEIPFIDFADVNTVKASLAEVGLEPGACGPRVRTVTACQGNSICPSGLIETSELAKELDLKYFAMDLPHKFKIGITGCKNNCLKAEENDLGIKGGLKPKWNVENCSYCGVCEAVCPFQAIVLNSTEDTLSFDESKCLYCGKCVKSCPTDAWGGTNGYLLSFGGTFGNELVFGEQILPLITNKQQLFKLVDAAIEFYREHGQTEERFRFTIDRVGKEKLTAKLEEALND